MRFLIVQHDDDTPLGSLAAPLHAHGTVEHWLVRDTPAPPAPVADYGGLVLLGGITHPDQDEAFPWLRSEVDVLREALDRRVPMLGVCLGGQLLARAAGGRVGPAHTSEIGWYQVRLAPEASDDPVLGGLEAPFHAFQWHHYAFEPPPDAVSLASTPAACQAYRLRDHAWGLQFHIEVDHAIVGSWLDHPEGTADVLEHGFDAAAIRAATREHERRYVAAARDLAERFARVALGLRTT